MKEDPPPDAKCRDKFLVQTVAITAEKEFNNVAALVGAMAELYVQRTDAAVVVPHRANFQVLHPREEDSCRFHPSRC